MQRLTNKLRSLTRRSAQPERKKMNKLMRPLEKFDWEAQWGGSGYVPPWRLNGAPPELLPDLLSAGWISTDMTVLDIGCGDGQVSGWLAQQGFKSVMGVDVSPAAIQRARDTFGHLPNIEFAVHDITEDAPTQTFDFLFDRGCFHVIPASFLDDYVTYVKAASHSGTRLLLMHFIFLNAGGTYESTMELIRRTLEPAFTLEEDQEIGVITRDGQSPSVAMQMVRTGE